MRNRDLVKLIQRYLTDDLRRAPWKGNSNKLAGHCYVASETFYYMSGGPLSGFKPCHINLKGVSHWYLSKGDYIIDITSKQFDHELDYSKGRGKGFLTKKPSKRSWLLMQRIADNA